MRICDRAACFSIASVLAMASLCHPQTPGGPRWLGSWSASPMVADGGFRVQPFGDMTLREIVRVSVGGKEIRVRFTNEFGTDPLTIADAHVAISDGGPAIRAQSDRALLFGGSSSVRIPPGAALFSDPVSLDVPALSDLAVSFYLPGQVMRAETFHDFADEDNYAATGDVSGAVHLPQPTILSSWYFLDGIDVSGVEGGRAIVTLGDSITDGAHSTRNANRRWTDILAARLQADGKLKNVSVLNEGIGGNRVFNEGYGPSAISRFDRDVLSQDGVAYVIVLESINDIGRLAHLQSPEDEITAQQLQLGLSEIADAAHQHGIKAIGATLTPYTGASYFSDKGEQIRKQLNDWIRTSGTFDGVIDFDKITADSQDPDRFKPQFDSGDHLHPGDEGYKSMGEGIDLKLFSH
jgi:lysophospholipase L1-like esterase